jgi:hypothetical protein
MNISVPRNISHVLIGIFSAVCRFRRKKAIKKTARNANKMECVKPRCINKSSAVSDQNDAIKSMSGKLAAIAPYNMALFPIFLPRKRSPIQAPIAICVKLSTWYFIFPVNVTFFWENVTAAGRASLPESFWHIQENCSCRAECRLFPGPGLN